MLRRAKGKAYVPSLPMCETGKKNFGLAAISRGPIGHHRARTMKNQEVEERKKKGKEGKQTFYFPLMSLVSPLRAQKFKKQRVTQRHSATN